MFAKLSVLFLFGVAATSARAWDRIDVESKVVQSVHPKWEEDQVYYVTSSDGGVLTAYPEEPADFPGHTYPIPGKVFVELPQDKAEQKWTISELTSGWQQLTSASNRYNEVDTYMATSQSFPMTNFWNIVEAGDGQIYITSRTFEGRCLNNNGLGSRILQSICDSAGSGSKWTLTPVDSKK